MSNTFEVHVKPKEYGNLTNIELQIFTIPKLTVCACQQTTDYRSVRHILTIRPINPAVRMSMVPVR
jgi:hypothetical protein